MIACYLNTTEYKAKIYVIKCFAIYIFMTNNEILSKINYNTV